MGLRSSDESSCEECAAMWRRAEQAHEKGREEERQRVLEQIGWLIQTWGNPMVPRLDTVPETLRWLHHTIKAGYHAENMAKSAEECDRRAREWEQNKSTSESSDPGLTKR